MRGLELGLLRRQQVRQAVDVLVIPNRRGAARQEAGRPQEEEELVEVFNVFDKDGDGVISLDDLVARF